MKTLEIYVSKKGSPSWSHYWELLSIDDLSKRSFYEKKEVEAIVVEWHEEQ